MIIFNRRRKFIKLIALKEKIRKKIFVRERISDRVDVEIAIPTSVLLGEYQWKSGRKMVSRSTRGALKEERRERKGGRGTKANNRGGSRPVINAPLNDKPSRLQM